MSNKTFVDLYVVAKNTKLLNSMLTCGFLLKFMSFVFLQPAAIDDLRKWTSVEAIGDITVTPDCMVRLGAHNSSLTTFGNNSTLTPTAEDTTDDIVVLSSSNGPSNNTQEIDEPLDHRLPSPEEQCQILALK